MHKLQAFVVAVRMARQSSLALMRAAAKVNFSF
jgi:hypothetical protein